MTASVSNFPAQEKLTNGQMLARAKAAHAITEAVIAGVSLPDIMTGAQLVGIIVKLGGPDAQAKALDDGKIAVDYLSGLNPEATMTDAEHTVMERLFRDNDSKYPTLRLDETRKSLGQVL